MPTKKIKRLTFKATDFISDNSARIYIGLTIMCGVMLMALFAACGGKDTAGTAATATDEGFWHAEGNGIYYWKTVLETDSAERAFLRENNVTRAYVRFFDVVCDDSPLATEEIIPNATLQIRDTLPVSEIIPTIYITLDALKRMKGEEEEWAERIVKRASNMCEYNDLGQLEEIQLDCDWTATTDTIYFTLCKEVKSQMKDITDHPLVSSTIRLHQLSKPAPPVDYGVLMLYNTGSFENPDEKNSILSEEVVRSYLSGPLADYPLHLDVAYPIYSWELVYRGNRFLGLVRPQNPIPDDILTRIGENRYTLRRDTIIGNTILRKGDLLRKEDASCRTLAAVKEIIENNLGEERHSTILYHLDSENLSRYDSNEIKAIYK